MWKTTHLRFIAPPLLALALMPLLSTGCPYLPPDEPGPDASDYDRGYYDGFMLDDWYWQGFDDSYDTVDGGPIYYNTTDIPYLEDASYDAGYCDGVWYAYNDGYFVSYDYAFTIGFSEGYDAAYADDYLEFLASDEHIEWADGGWTDGYNDGFSEGRVFGANDRESGIPFDWLDAMLDYRAGTDLYFEEIDVGTGVYGPVYLYEYGTDPLASKALTKRPPRGIATPLIRRAQPTKAGEPTESMYRALTAGVRNALDKQPATSIRGGRELKLTTTWLDRVTAYLSVVE